MPRSRAAAREKRPPSFPQREWSAEKDASGGQIVSTGSPDGKKLHLNYSDLFGQRKQEWLIDVPQPVRGTPEYLRLWIEVLTVSEQDSSGGVTELDYKTWQERFERLKKLGGPPTP